MFVAIHIPNFGGGFLSSLRARKELRDDRGLSRSLRGRNSLSVRVECHACGRMPK